MKHFLFLVLLSTVFESTAQILLHRQRFLVENQPQVISFAFENYRPLGKNDFTYQNQQADHFHNYYRLQGFFIPFANNGNLLMSLGAGYASDIIQDPTPDGFSETNQAVWLQWFHTGSIGKNLFWRWLTAYGTYTNQKISFKEEETYKLSQLLELGYKWNPNLATSIGAITLTNYGDFTVVPLVHIAYSHLGWVFDFFAPIDLSIRKIISNDFHLMAQHLINSRSYWYNNDLQALNYGNNLAMLKAEYRLFKVLWSELGIGYAYSGNYEWQDKKVFTEVGNLEEPLHLKLGVFVRFESF
jgi:hypothetical protein